MTLQQQIETSTRLLGETCFTIGTFPRTPLGGVMTRNHEPMNNIEHVQALAVETSFTTAATKWGMGGGTLTTAFGWLASNGAAVFIGIVVTVLGFVVNYVFQRRRDKREAELAEFQRNIELAEERRRQEMHEAQLAALRGERCLIE